MELRQLLYFCTVTDTMNFTRAAEMLYVSQPALSRQISDLERELGVTLLDRSKKALQLTPEGELLRNQARSILMQTEQLQSMLSKNSEAHIQEQLLWVGMAPDSGNNPMVRHDIAEAIYQKRRQIPGLRIIFHQNDVAGLKNTLMQKKLDMAVYLTNRIPPSETLVTVPFRLERMVMLLRSKHTYPDTLESVKKILDHRGIMLLEREFMGLSCASNTFSALDCFPKIRYADNFMDMLATVESGESAVMLPESVLSWLRSDHLQLLHLPEETALVYYVLSWRADDPRQGLYRSIAELAANLAKQENVPCQPDMSLL